jgi:hypothetical protein
MREAMHAGRLGNGRLPPSAFAGSGFQIKKELFPTR